MKQAPLIVGAGGINAAGRTSGHQGYKRLVFPALPEADKENFFQDLASRMGLQTDSSMNPVAMRARILADTLVRDVSDELPWTATRPVRTAAPIPRGFDPGALYPSHGHPMGIRMAVYAVSDAIASLGVPWEEVCNHIRPDEISVYVGSSIGQIDDASMAELVRRSMGARRVSSKLLPFAFADMPANFINSYILHGLGSTGASLGACTSFLHNMHRGVQDIQSGRSKVAVVGGAEAPIEPPVLDGFAAMGALATVNDLPLGPDGLPDHRRACRPFGDSTGFVLGESAQVLILMADGLALKLGADILGMVAEVFVHADGAKKSITEPGIGNYVTMLKAAALVRSLRRSSGSGRMYVHAHGSGTPLNCATEARILQEVAVMLGEQKLAVTSIKPLVGHSLGTAAGDQIVATLGAWRYGWVPGVTTIDEVAEQGGATALDVLTRPREVRDVDMVIVNSKGFGGNNASAVLLSPNAARARLEERYGDREMSAYAGRREKVSERIRDADSKACAGKEVIRFIRRDDIDDQQRIRVADDSIHIDSYSWPILLPDGAELLHYFRAVALD